MNTYTSSFQDYPSVGVGEDGDFVVVWSDGSYYCPNSYYDGQDGSGCGVFGQLFDKQGHPIGGEFQINTYTTYMQGRPSVAVGNEGDFIVVWQSEGSNGTDPTGFSIQAQRFASDGAPLSGEFQVNSLTSGWQESPMVASASDGDFFVVWNSVVSNGTDSDNRSIQARRLSSDGTPLGVDFQVNTYTTSIQNRSALSFDSEGNLVVVWHSYIYPDGASTIFGQRFGVYDRPIGTEFQIDTYSTDGPGTASVACRPGGRFVVVWSSEGSNGTDSSTFSVQGQGFDTPIFVDGFESGDTSAWSSSP